MYAIRSYYAEFLPKMKAEMDKAGVTLKGCVQTKAILKDIQEATEEDWSTEYLDLILSVKVVAGVA